MIVYADVDDLACDIGRAVRERPDLIVSVDGFDGSGKSTVSNRLAASLEICSVELDTFLARNMGGYLPYLRYDEIASHVEHLRHGGQPILIEGVCVQAVLVKLGLRSRTVYVKRLVAGYYWSDGDVLREVKTAAEAIAREEEKLDRLSAALGEDTPSGGNRIGGLSREIIEYHFSYRPHENADRIYQWNE